MSQCNRQFVVCRLAERCQAALRRCLGNDSRCRQRSLKPQRIRPTRRTALTQRSGAAVVEFAFAAPILFVFILACVEFGRLTMIRHTADNAAYEAARYAMVPGATSSEAIEKATQLLASVGARNVEVAVDPEVLAPETETITVTVRVPVTSNSWVVPKYFSSYAIEAQSHLATERYNPE
ncbi:TadE/TadG family type IV pilus assembly protein [Blastopirellula marina]|uniref:Transporter n=1 Tax=Blastopirellula marina TaxID=124 RepID=A0A2S8FWJ1_9BACT|nr:TadE family protein [Blastopirellula marina]PQO36547.1 transporter [Blastopirellula marina]PQO47496.1 transporter [Blastopirellula marina]PTL44386.1 pilus assembly protein [Blastopirellula marina]